MVVHVPSFDYHWHSLVDSLYGQRIHNVVAQPNPAWCAEAIVEYMGPAGTADDTVPLQAHVDEAVKDDLTGGLVVVVAQEGSLRL